MRKPDGDETVLYFDRVDFCTKLHVIKLQSYTHTLAYIDGKI